MITENLSTLKIHKLTKTQYDREVANGTIDENALYLTPDDGEEIDLSAYMTYDNPVGTGSFSINRKADTTIGNYSVAEGFDTTASGYGAHAEGYETTASGGDSHAEGCATTASGDDSHAEGVGTLASAQASHAEGNGTKATCLNSHAEGNETIVTNDDTVTPTLTDSTDAGYCGHAEGYGTVSYGAVSHAEGNGTIAYGYYSHAEGTDTAASGYASHAEGQGTESSGTAAHAEGYHTTALSYQHAQGHYNNITTATTGASTGAATGTAFVIGCGTESSAKNAFRVTYNGKIFATSSAITAGADYAEFFEWQDSNLNNEDRRGYFVTLDGDKIKIAEPDDYILGIISGRPAMIGNGDEEWMGRYILDEFGDFITEEFEYEENVIDKETGEMKTVTKTSVKYKENPDYDSTRPYVQREDRPEWDAVGMVGVLSVRDDGTCQVNGFCNVTNGGIATASESGYRVIKRINENIVKVVFR